MSKIKKLSLMICSFILVLTGFLFVGCAKTDYSKITVTASVGNNNVNSVTLDKGDDVAITFTINNYFDGMNGELEVSAIFDTTDCFTYQVSHNGKESTTVIVSGTMGGRAHLYATTKEGGKSCDVEIIVNEYSTILSNNDKNLYLTENTSLTPSSKDFVFNSSSTKRDLDFYFYGIKSSEDKDLTLDMIKNNENKYLRKFVNISLIYQNQKNYLLFEDEEGNLYSIQDVITSDPHVNIPLTFIPATKTGDEYSFGGSGAKAVNLGDKFTFFAVYTDNLGNEYFVVRDFHVLKDLKGDQITYSYKFASHPDNPNNKVYGKDEKVDLILIPNKEVGAEPFKISYKSLTLDIELPSDTDLVDMDYDIPEYNGIQLVNIVKNPSIVEEGKTIYSLTLTSTSITSVTPEDLTFDINFFYKGYNDIKDASVNYKLQIPLKIIYEPESMSVNGDSLGSTSYIFYNNYAATNVGWQEFNIEYAPNDGAFSQLEIEFNPNQVIMMYRGVQNKTGHAVLENLNAPIYFKGVNGATEIDNGSIKLHLKYRILEDGQIDYIIPYSIITGASRISFADADHATYGIYVGKGDNALFNQGLFADAYFQKITFQHIGDSDVVDFSTNGEAIKVDDKYFLSFNVFGKDIGSGKYNITLDNGTSITATFKVIETLDSVSALVQSDSGSVAYNESDDKSTLLYIRNSDSNKFGEKARVLLLANGKQNSTAIISYNFVKDGNCFRLSDSLNGYINVQIETIDLAGSGKVKYTISGYDIQDFKRVEKTLEYDIDIVSYNLIDGLNVIKLHDGTGDFEGDKISAGNVTVYYGTSNVSKKTATFEVYPKQNGFLFYNPINKKFEESEFSKKFISWTANATIRKDGVPVDQMIYEAGKNNRYTIDGIGIFDTETCTFEAFNYEILTELTATVRQYDRPYSFTISIRSIPYNDVTMLTIQDYEQNKELTFSASETSKSLVLFTTPRNATDPSIDFVYTGTPMFGEKSNNDKNFGIKCQPIGNDSGTFLITLSISEDFIKSDEAKQNQELSGTIIFASADWIAGNNVLSQYERVSVPIKVYFANGTEKSPYNLSTPKDVLAIKNRPDAHYKISTTIDMTNSGLVSLGDFEGSIIGTTEQAQIVGINLTQGSESKNYGLFSTISRGAIISGVKFKGHFDIAIANEAGTYNVGLIAGINEGQIINVGVEFNAESKVVIENASSRQEENRSIYVGGVVGSNFGIIKQDYTEYTLNNSKVKGQTPNILMFSSEYNLNISSQTNSRNNADLYVGGVTGKNSPGLDLETMTEIEGSGKIIKIDNPALTLYGYSDYLAYLNIKVSGNNKNHIGMVAGISTGVIRGYAKCEVDENANKVLDEDGNEILIDYSLTNSANTYSAGRGIVVGGSIVDESLVNERFNDNSYSQYIGGVVGELGSISKKFNYNTHFSGITARVSVLGTLKVGALTGYSYAELGEILPALAMQTVDSGKTDFYASMVAIINQNASKESYDDCIIDKNTSRVQVLNKIAFGGFAENAAPEIMKDEEAISENENDKDRIANVFSYVNRTKSPVFEENLNNNMYYGDFIVAKALKNNDLENPLIMLDETQYLSLEFTKSKQGMSVNANADNGFASFKQKDSNGEYKVVDNIFYMYYFRSAGFVYQEEDVIDFADSQNVLDEKFNAVSTSSALYPLEMSRGMVLKSLSTDILTFDQSGKIIAKSTGLAKIQLSSILDTNNSLIFYIYVVDYFNRDISKSIVYPTPSSFSTAIDESIIEIKGDSSLNLYIRPTNDCEMSLNGEDQTKKLIINNGIIMGGTNVRLNSNEVISANLKVYRIDTTSLEQQKVCVYNSDGEIDVQNPEVDVQIIGQTITFNHNEYTKDYFVNRIDSDGNKTSSKYKYMVEISPMIKVEIEENKTINTYICDVNKYLDKVELRYLKGAEKLDLSYDTRTLLTSNEFNDEIIVTTTREDEGKPYYVINRNGRAYFSTYEKVKPITEDEMFKVTIGQGKLISKDTSSGRYVYSYSVKIRFNLESDAYKKRYDEDIYGDYQIDFYANTDPTKYKSLKIILERTNVEKINIDNYSDINTASDFSSTSKIGVPGKNGLLAITLIPQDCDFEYIIIENDESNYLPGNGVANFSLVSRSSSGEFQFKETPIMGTVTSKGIRYSLQDILKAYKTGDYKDDNDTSIKPYNGMLYLRYNIGTSGVSSNGKSKFNVTVCNGNDRTPESISLDLKMEFKANVDLVGKQPIIEDNMTTHAIYQVARGLRYQLSLDDIWGFAKENVELSLDNEQFATLIEENGNHYLQITNEEITYIDDYFEFNIIARARQKDGEIERDVTSQTTIRISEFVVNYNNDIDKNKDVIKDMDKGIIDVLIGNRQTLAVDLIDFIEFDSSNTSVKSKIDAFMADLTNLSDIKLYTNLDALGKPTLDEVSLDSEPSIINKDAQFENAYVRVNGFNVVPKTTHKTRNPYYIFTYNGRFDLEDGVYKAISTSQNIGQEIETKFVFNVFQSSSEESPIPIDNYQDFIDMQAGANYILIDDIVIPNANTGIVFEPISKEIASLDGNSYKIIFEGRYNFGNTDVMSLFREVGSSTILKNITIQLTRDVVFATDAAMPFSASLVAGSNLGVITNCNIISEDEKTKEKFYFSATSPNLNNSSYIAGLVVNNSGSITNSRSAVNIETTFNASGFVATNSGKIASSYFKGGEIKVNSSGNHVMAGFVISNTDAGKIITSYVSGIPDKDYVYSRDTINVLTSNYAKAGFVFNNEGYISDCYTNIKIEGSSTMAGFVHNNGNGGRIVNCFSTSVLVDRTSVSGGFAKNKFIDEDESEGTFENCYFFKNDSNDWNNGGYPNILINASLSTAEFAGVKALNRDGFMYDERNPDKFNENFGSYAVYNLTNVNTDSVWFYAKKDSSYSVYDYQTFNSGRLELVSANIIASSKRDWAKDRTVTESTGDIHYEYDYDINYPALGSKKNPYIVKNARDFENLIQEGKTTSGYNYKHYRVVDDLNYVDLEDPSLLYKVSFAGVLEGNGMDIRNILLASADKLEYAGLFAQIGRNSTNYGVVMNLNIYPTTDIAFTNSSIVGGLAGKLNNGYIFNVNIDREANIVNVAGANFVGGLIGLAQDNYKIFNSSSNLSAVANYTPKDQPDSYEDSNDEITEFSYAGGLIGYATGNGLISTTVINGVNTVMGERAGLAFGGVGRRVSVRKLDVTPIESSKIRAYKYGGLVVGEARGTFDIVRVNSAGVSAEAFNPFTLYPGNPEGAGGIAGLMQGGSLSKVQINQGFTVGSYAATGDKDEINTRTIDSVGGVIGIVEKFSVNLNQIEILPSFYASRKLGGVIASARSSVEMHEIAVKSSTLRVAGFNTTTNLAGFVASSNSKLSIYDSYCKSNLQVNCYTYATANSANVSGFIALSTAANITMQRCYYSGEVDVVLDDKRSNADSLPFEGSEADANRAEYVKINVANVANTLDNITPESGTINYNTSKITDVYYYGRPSTNPLKPQESIQGRPEIRFSSNASLASSTLNYRTFGLDSFSYSQNMYNQNQGEISNTAKADIYNLFDYYLFEYDRTETTGATTKVIEELYYVPAKEAFVKVGTNKNANSIYYKWVVASNRYELNGTSGSRGFAKSELTVGGISKRGAEEEQGKIKSPYRGHDNLRSIWIISDKKSGDLSVLAFEGKAEEWFN